MATKQLQALADVQNEKTKILKDEYQGKMSNQFVEELKSSTLFQCDWGELLSAAPTALSLMGACWIAASQEKADAISLTGARPDGGWKFLKNYDKPTLRSCLVDEDFNDALKKFSDEAKTCARLATEIRIAFNTWGRMVGELHASTEQKKGLTSIENENTKMEQAVTEIEQTFAVTNSMEAEKAVASAATRLKRNEDRLGSLSSSSEDERLIAPQTERSTMYQALGRQSYKRQSAIQAVPVIVGGILPAVLQAANPAAAVANALGASMKKSNQSTIAPQATTELQQSVLDPAYASAAIVKPILELFYEFLGGEKGEVNWDKLSDAPPAATDSSTSPKSVEQGVSFLIGNLNGLKSNIDVAKSQPSKALANAIDRTVKVAISIKDYQRTQKDLNSEKAATSTIAGWKAEVKLARATTLKLSTTASSTGSTNIPNPYANIKIDVPKADLSAQNVAASNAMQGVQMAQQAVDVAQANYDESVAKQAKMAAAMAAVGKKLIGLQQAGKLLENVKIVLRDCISVLVDLTVQIGKLEKFFTVLTTVIDNIILVRAEEFKESLAKAGRRSLNNGFLKIDDLEKQTIYIATLQIKAYFSLLMDISSMYTSIDRSHITKGVDLCSKLSKSAASKETSRAIQDELSTYSESAAKEVAKIVSTKQQEILEDLKARAQRAAATTQLLEDTLAQQGLPIDQSAKEAIEQGGQAVKEEAKAIILATESATVVVVASEETNANDF
ncbi:MAG: hypothetical protein Q9171_006011 [Xanthocarpia ochracea]